MLLTLVLTRHLLTDETSGEGLTSSQGDFLLDTLEVNQDGMVWIADIVQLIQQQALDA